MSERRNIFDSLFSSFRDATSFKNLAIKFLLLLFFGILLSIRTLVKNLDKVGVSHGGVIQYLQAFMKSVYHGVGVSLASIWSLITQWSIYVDTHAWGSMSIGIIMGLAVIGFIYQPVSILVNIFDGKDKKDTGNESGNATGVLMRLAFTLLVVLILSVIVFYSGISESILSDNQDIQGDDTITPEINQTQNDSIVNALDMLDSGGG